METDSTLQMLLRLGAAYVLGVPVGWITAGIGAAVAHGEFLLGFLLSIATTATLHVHTFGSGGGD